MNCFISDSGNILGLPLITFTIAFATPATIFLILTLLAVVKRRRGGSRK